MTDVRLSQYTEVLTQKRLKAPYKETCMEKLDVEKDEKKKDSKKRADENPQDSIFDTEEIRIEEMAIDGICGVY
jgi:mycofactocin precursor